MNIFVYQKSKSGSDGSLDGVLALLSCNFPYLSLKKVGDDTQQALALGEVIKMFINTNPSRC